MARRVLNPEEAKELIRLLDEHEAAVKNAAAILQSHGIHSKEFTKANNTSDELWDRIQDFLGEAERQWLM